MRTSTTLLVLCCLFLQACCCPSSLEHRHTCLAQPEPPFDLPDDRYPGLGLVYGTADFGASGAVLIKLQVEDLSAYAGSEAAVTAWSGNGSHPGGAVSDPSTLGAEVYSSSGDIYLRHWTSHLARNYVESTDKYWIYVRVDHRTGDTTREVKDLWWEWTPSATSEPDTPHDFHAY